MNKLLIITILFLYSFQATSQQRGSTLPDTISNKRLQDVEVTSRVKLTSKTTVSTEASASPASVTLVGRDILPNKTINSYWDLLRPLAGINISNFQLGGVGYGIQMRGYTVTEHVVMSLFQLMDFRKTRVHPFKPLTFECLSLRILSALKLITVPLALIMTIMLYVGQIAFETLDKDQKQMRTVL